MKTMLALALSLMVSAVSAKSLAEYDASYSFDVRWPVVGFSGAQVPVKNVCTDGDLLKTINPVKVCTETAVVEVCKRFKDDEVCSPVRAGKTYKEDNRTRLVYGCVNYATKDLQRSKFYETKECSKWKRTMVGGKDKGGPTWTCLEYSTVTKEIAENYDVEVFSTRGKDRYDYPVATKDFSLPACE